MKDKVLLIMDNCGPHGADISDPLGQVKTIALPPNCTAVHQTMDQGIIAAIKRVYHYKLLHKILENIENCEQRHQASQRTLAGTASLDEGREAHLLDVMKILYQVWNDMEVSTITHSWARSKILDPTMEADIRAEYASRSKCAISDETKASLDDIIFGLTKLSLPKDTSLDDSIMESVHALSLLHQSKSSAEAFAAELETWTQIEETDEFKELMNQEKEESISEDTFILAICTKKECNSPDEKIDEEPASIAALDVADICGSLIDLQQLLEKHGVTAAAEYLEKARNEMFHASRMAQCKPDVNAQQTLMDAFLKPADAVCERDV